MNVCSIDAMKMLAKHGAIFVPIAVYIYICIYTIYIIYVIYILYVLCIYSICNLHILYMYYYIIYMHVCACILKTLEPLCFLPLFYNSVLFFLLANLTIIC